MIDVTTHRAPRRFRLRNFEGYLFILPWMIGFFLFALGPLVISMRYSVLQWDMFPSSQPEYVGLKNYQDLMANPDFWWSLRRTALYAIMAVPATMIGSLAVAMLLNQKVPGHHRFPHDLLSAQRHRRRRDAHPLAPPVPT